MENFLRRSGWWLCNLSPCDLPTQYPTLQEVIIEFGTPTEHKEVLNKMIEEFALGNYNVAHGQQLLVDPPSFQDPDWIMSFGSAPEGMVSRAVRWKGNTRV